MSTVIESNQENVRIIQLNHENKHNPFSKELENAVKEALINASHDESVAAVVVYGGQNRSFSAGGDFNEVKNLSGGKEVDDWIDRVFDLYSTVLHVEKPTVAAIGGMAIGMGFQFGLMFDWRVMASDAHFVMPELKHGIGCSVGAAILEDMVGWNTMRDIIYRCEKIDAEQASAIGLINEIADASTLVEKAIQSAKTLAAYPQVAFRATKQKVNGRLLNKLIESSAASKEVHRAAFSARDAQKHFQTVLKAKYHRQVPAPAFSPVNVPQ